MVNCYYCNKYMEHPPFHHWVVPGVRASVTCDGCHGYFEVWTHELWYQSKITKESIIINK
jgi:hypothetical protein